MTGECPRKPPTPRVTDGAIYTRKRRPVTLQLQLAFCFLLCSCAQPAAYIRSLADGRSGNLPHTQGALRVPGRPRASKGLPTVPGLPAPVSEPRQ